MWSIGVLNWGVYELDKITHISFIPLKKQHPFKLRNHKNHLSSFFFHMLKLNYVPFTLLIFYVHVFVDCSSIYVYSVVCKCISDLPPVVCNGNPGTAKGKYSITMNKCRFLNSCENVIPWFNCFAWNIKLWGPNVYHNFTYFTSVQKILK